MSRRTTPLQDAINHILARRDKNSMLEIKFINSVKGRGIFTLANFKQGDFVVEYRGELIDATEAEHRRNLYPSACSVFMFEFIWKQKTLCIDGALEDGSFGRLVNDEHRTPNCRMKLIEAEGKPHLCLFALKEIAAGSEITYDYGGKEWPWRKKLKIASIPSGQQCVAEPIAHDVEHHVISTDSFTDRELRAECQSSRPTADNSEHEVHSVGGQRGTSSLKELIGEVGVQYQELSPQAFSEELTSESKSKEVPQSSRAVPNDSACECTIHRLVFESVKLDKCGICHSPLTAIRWHGLRCKHDQGNDACVTSGSPPVPDSVTKGLCVSSRRCVKRPWSEEEIGAVMKHMKPFIENGITVTNQQCLKCKEKEQPILETRSIQNIRDFVRNRGLAFKKNK
ncbi:uncharacterized protein LOC120741045 isoform X1 [Simochromis diagramma]|uniref:uncharacterized protein LOC120741045 isoform X1 n=1 Tax=Simochromis diagramma TaxID=43689 RepID=UPI001A7F057A|nr:uncharacterized protein LOC120741045 isoform X1 [Simochromis diagramma]